MHGLGLFQYTTRSIYVYACMPNNWNPRHSSMRHKHQAGIKTKTWGKTLFKFCPDIRTRATTETQKQHGVIPPCIYTCVYVYLFYVCVHGTITHTLTHKRSGKQKSTTILKKRTHDLIATITAAAKHMNSLSFVKGWISSFL